MAPRRAGRAAHRHPVRDRRGRLQAPRPLAREGRARAAAATCPPPSSSGPPNTLHGLVTDFSEQAWELVDAFWPGALTLVAKHQPSLAWDLGETRGTVAVRMPLHPVAIELLTEVGPMAVSSANLHRAPGARGTATPRARMLGDSVSVYLDGGPTPGMQPSSIVDVTGKVPVLLREGALTRRAARGGRTRPRGGTRFPEGRGIAKSKKKKKAGSFRILHVSTGNVCRSPITERLTRHALSHRLGVS